ncbi:MAG TPA: hypothetical protein VGM86_11715 [Thermoanaerobaculia bacterium]|jgi:hypothetical protein
MPARKIVKVDYDGINGSLTLDRSSVQLAQGDWVEWKFSKVPRGCIPWIRFEGSRGLGPFQCLQLVPSTTTLQGKGNVGADHDESYSYTAWLLTRDGVRARSAVATVENLRQAQNTTPEVVVSYSEGKLDVQPETLELEPGDMATWNVLGLPAGYFVFFQFDSLKPLFDSYLNCRLLLSGDDSGVVRICGIHFNSRKRRSHYHYHITVRDPSGIIVASHDPMIDNLGQPGPPDCDGH